MVVHTHAKEEEEGRRQNLDEFAQEHNCWIIWQFLVFWKTCIRFSITAVPIYIPTNSVEGTHFSPLSPAFVICRHFNNGHFDWCEVVPHCSFDLHLSINQWYWASFHVPTGHLYVLLGEMSIKVFCPFFNWVGCFVYLLIDWCWVVWAICIFSRIKLCESHHLQIFSPIP